MNYSIILEKLEALKVLLEKARSNAQTPMGKSDFDTLYMLYGEVEEVIDQLEGIQKIEVPEFDKRRPSVFYKNYIEAGYLSRRQIYQHEGYTQLIKIIGRVRQLAEDPTLPRIEPSVSHLVQTIRRFRECCQYLSNRPNNEKDVQDILWIILRSHFERIDREEVLPRFGAKAYKPDFGIPDLRVLIEVKYIGEKINLPSIQEEILSDIPGYLGSNTKYDGIIIFIYDAAQKLRDSRKFVEDLRSVEGIIDIVITPGI
ncbi:MAG: hypothetical protein PHE84_01765 [bacterium]|nr:hypothetical protein [bacterium]